MKLHEPFEISSRLLPSVKLGGATIQLEYAGTGERQRYKFTIDLPDGSEHTGDDLYSGCQGGDLQEGFESLLSFLSACGDSWRHCGRHGENSGMFPQAVAEWAAMYTDELGLLADELAGETKFIEE